MHGTNAALIQTVGLETARTTLHSENYTNIRSMIIVKK